MQVKPKAVHWFEVRVPREETAYALELLASSGSVELEETGYLTKPCVDMDQLRHALGEFDRLARRCGEDFPADEAQPTLRLEQPERLAAEAVRTLRDWHMGLLQLKRRLAANLRTRSNLLLLAECLEAMAEGSTDIGLMERPGQFLYKHIFACPKGGRSSPYSTEVYNRVYRGREHDFWFVAGDVKFRAVIEGTSALVGCRPMRLPSWLPAAAKDQGPSVQSHLRQVTQDVEALRQAIVTHKADLKVRNAIADMSILRWYLDVAIHPTPDHRACQLTGWTTAETPQELQRQLTEAGIDASLVFAEPRSDLLPPVQLSNRPWTRPFQLFVRILGTPGRNEIDPTPLLAFLVPLLFGFMFPDVGHGLILAAGGFLLSRYHASAIILVPCGLAATGFGIFFGEVFGIHGLIPSVCGCPLDNPLPILLATLALGVGLIMVGLIFSGVEAYWRGMIGVWLLDGAPVLILYLAAPLALIRPEFGYLAIAAVCWYLAGIGWLCRKDEGGCIAARLGNFVESAMRLAVNSLSFMRVGAFALAHSALSLVVLELTRMIDDPTLRVLAFILGHAGIIVVEGAIVMIQTTRLILFEFFMHFLRFEGRIYKPLSHQQHS